jgi:malonyl-CoA O-methyltransferase
MSTGDFNACVFAATPTLKRPGKPAILCAVTIQNAYNRWSKTYDSDPNATRDLDALVLRDVIGGTRFGAVVEIGCGTGKNTRLLAQLADSVRALDFSAGMISQAKQKLSHLPNITFAIADITRRWPCANRSANLVVCNLVLEHVRDLAPVFCEARRVLDHGGVLFISELHPFRQYAGTVANFRRDRKTTRIPAFIHHLSDFIETAGNTGFTLKRFQEWWHEKDKGKAPRLVSFLFSRNDAVGIAFNHGCTRIRTGFRSENRSKTV